MSSKKIMTGTVKSIDGEDVNLEDYAGKVVLVVNVASQCGRTPQYEQLQALHEKYAGQGLVVLGFPCNQFGAQEPGSAEEIKGFCEIKYQVSFPMFEKIDVNGENAAPLFRALTSEKASLEDRGPVKWNFEKFLFNRQGEVIARYRSGVKPDAEEVIGAIEKALSP